MFQRKKGNLSLLIIFALILILIIIFLSFRICGEKSRVISINGRDIRVELAINSTDKIRGLGGRPSINDDEGMLFVYDAEYLPQFWMKNMLFPIDIIWINDDMVVGFEKNVPLPSGEGTELVLYSPKTFVDKVLEVKSGFVDKHGLKIGDQIDFSRLVDKNGQIR